MLSVYCGLVKADKKAVEQTGSSHNGQQSIAAR